MKAYHTQLGAMPPNPRKLLHLLPTVVLICACNEGGLFLGDGPLPTDQRVPREQGPDGPDADQATSTTPDASPTMDKAKPADQAGPQDFGNCKPVTAKASPDPWTVRHKGAGFGGLVSQKTGKHSDVLLKGPADYIRVGARLNWGGAVVFFGLTSNVNSNVIDANDTGRELQLALYDPTRATQGCAHNASCKSGGKGCGNSITFLGWNPVQGGDECGNGGKVLSHGKKGDALRLVIQPVQWNPDWNAPDCRKSSCPSNGLPVAVEYTYELRFVSKHVVEVMSQVVSSESFSHPSTGQEFPTLYVSHGKGGPDLPLLLKPSGAAQAITKPGNDGFYFENFSTTAPWVTWQNSTKSYGVGLAMDQGITKWQGWRGDGKTGPYFHNVRASIAFALGAGKTVRGISYMALGSAASVKADLTAVLAKRPPFGSLDEPAAGDVKVKPGASLKVRGWALDTTKAKTITVTLDGKTLGTVPMGQARADVCAIYPAYAGCPAVGFSGTISVKGLGTCPALMRVTATDADGNSTVLGERRLLPK